MELIKYASLIEAIDNFVSLAEKLYGPYSKSDGRKIVIIKKDDNSCRTVSYPKYLMEQHLGRELDANDGTVDHINRNFNDNDINNLRVVPRAEHSRDDTRRVKLIKLKCSMCKKKFERSPRLLRDKSKKGNRGTFCSKKCSGRYSRQLQLGNIKKMPIQPFIKSVYYRNKKADLITRFSKKYG